MNNHIEIRLYGKLRRVAPDKRPDGESILNLNMSEGTIRDILDIIGIKDEEVSNIFINGKLSDLDSKVRKGDRVGIFPRDMSLLYV